MSLRYKKSEAMLERARRTIPLGAQTFSKSITQFPFGVSPYFAEKASGSRLWDVDGNEYVDFVNGLAAVTLGYGDSDVNAAVVQQLAKGTVFSLSGELEAAVAEEIVAMVPCAEMVRFGKNGSDATAGAVRIARAWTGRDLVLVCGYHGWQDWYIGATTRNKGVPAATSALTERFPYNDAAALEALLKQHSGQVAAIIMEAGGPELPIDGYLQQVRRLATEHGAVLIFDETITGFRFANGGAQELYNVTPDLATLGKGLANGFPLSAVCGRRDIMTEMEEVFFSFTMGGELLSLAAALACLQKMRQEPVIETVRQRGSHLVEGLKQRIVRHGASSFARVSGEPSWSFLLLDDAATASAFELKTLLLQELFVRGFLFIGTHNMSYAHSAQDIDSLLAAYDEILPMLKDVAENGALKQYLHCDPLVPLFKLR
jgi:glutamate-1-semialdehyde 2,1-aminomutase